jgi:hypothetical protein
MRITACLAITAFFLALLAGFGLVLAAGAAACPLALSAMARGRPEPRGVRVRSRG